MDVELYTCVKSKKYMYIHIRALQSVRKTYKLTNAKFSVYD